MAAAPAPEPGPSYAGKVAKKKQVTWAPKLGLTTSRWIRLPRPMNEEDFKLDQFKSFASFVSATFKRKTKSGEDKFHHAAEISFYVNHDTYGKDLYAARTIQGKNGAPFYSASAAEFDPVDKKLYLSGLPAKVDWSSVVKELSKFVEFFDAGTPAYQLEDSRYIGRRVVQVKKFKSVPTTRLYLTGGAHDGLGFSVFSVGQGQRQPVLKPERKCFCCQSYDHEVKDCPTKKKMKFSWNCTVCGLSSIKCVVGRCVFDRVKEEAATMFGHTEGAVPYGELPETYGNLVAVLKDRLSDGGKKIATKTGLIDENSAQEWLLQWSRLRLNWYLNKNWRVLHESLTVWIRSHEVDPREVG